jgi:hypothetical protein
MLLTLYPFKFLRWTGVILKLKIRIWTLPSLDLSQIGSYADWSVSWFYLVLLNISLSSALKYAMTAFFQMFTYLPFMWEGNFLSHALIR